MDEEERPYWLARWTIGGVRDGTTLGYLSAEDAEDERVRIESRLRLGMPSQGTSHSATVDAILKAYLEDLSARATPKHIENDIIRLGAVGKVLGRIVAVELTARHLVDYVHRRRKDEGIRGPKGERGKVGHRVGGGIRKDATGPAKRTIQYEVRLLLRAWRVARGLGLVDRDPPPEPSWKTLPDDGRPMRRLLEGEVARLVTAAHDERPELGRLVEFLAWCPRRPVAVFALRRKDCVRVLDERLPRRERQAYFSADKGGISRGWSPLTRPALEVLVEQLQATAGEPDDLVWQSETGRPMSPQLIWYPFRRASVAAKLEDVQPYDLRRFGAVRVYRQTGGDLMVTCEYTGHREVRTLLRYLSAERDAAEDLAETIGWTSEDDARRRLRVVE